MGGPQPGELGIGSVIGGYRIDAVLGRGGMGVVYRATQVALGRAVALKVIGPQFATDPAFRERFRQESQLAASLDHPNVITIYEAGEDDGRLFVSMRHVDGVDLRMLLAAEGPIEPGRAVAIVAQVASALDAAHAMGLVHRDVKPANILLEQRGGSERAYLSDFGLVKRIGADPALTGSAGWVGSVDFVAPEQVQGRPVDGRADIYALGAVLYTALTGQVPFPRADAAARLYASVNDPVPSLAATRPGLPDALDAAVVRAMAKDPGARFPSADALADAVTGSIGGGGPAAATGVFAGWGAPAGAGPLIIPAAAQAEAASPAPSAATAVLPLSPGPPGPWWRRHRWSGRVGAATAILVAAALVATAAGAWPSGRHAEHSRGVTTAAKQPGTAGQATAGTHPGNTNVTRGAHGAITVADVTGGNNGPPDQYQITIYDLRRSGPYVTLDLGIVCVKASSNSCGSGGDFGTINATKGVDGINFNNVAGIQLIAPSQKTEYQEVTDTNGERYCSALPPSLDVGPAIHLAWANFAAPPASTSAIDVVFPNGGPQIPAVPITPGPARTPAPGNEVIPAAQAPFDRPPDSTDTSGLTLPVYDLVSTVGGPSGSDAEAPGRSTLNLSSDVLFAFAKADLTPAAQGVLATVAGKIKGGASGVVTVTGYTDSVGDDSVNGPLSQARAQAVVAAVTPLIAGTPVTFAAAGDGSANPIAANTNSDGSDNPAGRALNRRVTIGYNVTTAPPPTGPAPAPPTVPAPAGAEAPPPVDYITTTDGSGQTSRYHITVNSLVRDGNFVVLHLTAACTSSTNRDDSSNSSCDGSSDFAGTDTVPPERNGALNTLAAIYLTDPTTNQVYIPVHDSQTAPLTAAVDPGWPVGSTYPSWLYFPAPPTSVRSITVELPGATAKIANVAIAS